MLDSLKHSNTKHTGFLSIELALVAYNGGPGYARRYARREVALYGETRDYVRKVLARVGADSR